MTPRPPKVEAWMEHAEKADEGGSLILSAIDAADMDTVESLIACQKAQAIILAKTGMSFDAAMAMARQMNGTFANILRVAIDLENIHAEGERNPNEPF